MVQEYIFILFSEMEDLAHYIVMDEAGSQITASNKEDSLKSLSYLCLNRHVVVLIPGKYVSFYKVTLPNGSRDKLQASLPYVLEDDISEDIENLSFILGPRLLISDQTPLQDIELEINEEVSDVELEDNKDVNINPITKKTKEKSSQYLVAVISKEVMDFYYNLFKKNSIKPDYLLSDNYCLNGQFNNQIYINGVEKQVYYLSKDNDIYTIDLENLKLFKDRLLENNSAKTEVYTYRVDEKLDISTLGKVIPVDSEVELFATKWLTKKYKLNFLTGKYKIFKVQLKNKLLWKAVLSLVVFIVIADFGISISKYMLLSQKVTNVNQQIEAEWNKVFPKNSGISLPSYSSEITALIAKETADAEKQELQNNLFSALNVLGITLNQYTNIELESISFVESQLKIKVVVPSIIVVNNFEKAFKTQDKRIKRISLKEENGAFIAGFMVTVG